MDYQVTLSILDTKHLLFSRSCHFHHKMDEYIISMKRFGEQRGQEVRVAYAEGFRQHLGHGFPKENILREILGDLVIPHET